MPFVDHKYYIDNVKENSPQNLDRDKSNRSYFGDDILDSYVENIKKDMRVFDHGAQGKKLGLTSRNQFKLFGPSTAR
jgi:hypothetical protein